MMDYAKKSMESAGALLLSSRAAMEKRDYLGAERFSLVAIGALKRAQKDVQFVEAALTGLEEAYSLINRARKSMTSSGQGAALLVSDKLREQAKKDVDQLDRGMRDAVRAVMAEAFPRAASVA